MSNVLHVHTIISGSGSGHHIPSLVLTAMTPHQGWSRHLYLGGLPGDDIFSVQTLACQSRGVWGLQGNFEN